MTQKGILSKTRSHVKNLLSGETSGHDWFHIDRVFKIATFIQSKEGGDLYIIQLAALLHDIADWKFNDDMGAGGKQTRLLLEKFGTRSETIDAVVYIVDNISFKIGTNMHKLKTLEGHIVQDADRLDAMGAIGIGRAFAFGGRKGNPLYDPTVKPRRYASLEEYRQTPDHTIKHFYEKLLLLKDGMNTKTGKRLAKKRHDFMKKFLDEFYKEWRVELK